MALKAIEVRILGCLLEKEATTPEQYPLSINSLVLACNQKTNRDPVTDYHEQDVNEALQWLRDKGLVRSFRGANERAVKHQHKLHEAFQLGKKDFAVLAVLLLRGPQTPGELRARTERYVHFTDVTEVEATLQKLAEHTPPLAENLGRGPGQSQDRWVQTLGVREEQQRPRVRGTPATTARVSANSEIAELQAEIDALKALVHELFAHLGLELPAEDEQQ
jgi:uncharacterized protein YceH (UPF0502 family)